MRKRVCLFGATGSIGIQTLDILEQHAERFELVAISAHTQVDRCFEIIQKFKPLWVVMSDVPSAQSLRDLVHKNHINTEVLEGVSGLEVIASLPEIDIVVAGIVGAAGLPSIVKAAYAGKTILLANKEPLVMAGSLLLDAVKNHGARLLPVDSEHNALFQCMPAGFVAGSRPEGVKKIILTASGGPFLHRNADTFSSITPSEAIKHPTWSMGPKISIDCATLMNKGLEVIEAHYLFQFPVSEIDVVIHPQSIVHSFVVYQDGSYLAQLGTHDMRIPLSYCLAWPERITNRVEMLDLVKMGSLQFLEPDRAKFPCLEYAYEAIKLGGTAPIVLNASNEVAVEAFQKGKLTFDQIPSVICEALNQIPTVDYTHLEEVYAYDIKARIVAEKIIHTRT